MVLSFQQLLQKTCCLWFHCSYSNSNAINYLFIEHSVLIIIVLICISVNFVNNELKKAISSLFFIK
jgi:hypothetical protein